ncbi:MAG: hypothetical protein ACJAVK_003533, partial [Akkermansiaceae bacterium]
EKRRPPPSKGRRTKPFRVSEQINSKTLKTKELYKSTQTKDDSRLRSVVWRHLHLHFVANHKSDKTLAHFAGNVGQYFMITWQGNLEHCSCKHGGDRSFDLDGFLLVSFSWCPVGFGNVTTSATAASAATSPEISWSSDNFKGMELVKSDTCRQSHHATSRQC